METVWIYVDTTRDAGDAEHLKVFAADDVAEKWSGNTILKAWRLSMRIWSDQ
jgi:hypothetical protein